MGYKGTQTETAERVNCEWLELKEVNGLPYVDKQTFARLRPLMTRFWKSLSKCASLSSGVQEETDINPFVSLEEMLIASAEAHGLKTTEVRKGEDLAGQLLSKARQELTYDTVLKVVRDSDLKAVRCTRYPNASYPIRAWTFGAFCYPGKHGVTAGTSQRPHLTRLLNEMLRKVVPDTCWTTVILNDGITYKPHRDVNNQEGTVNVVVCLDDSSTGTGGGLWIAEDDGKSCRRIYNNLKLQGTVYDIRRRPLKFNPSSWHGTEPWQGSRLSITAFTIGGWEQLGSQQLQRLQELGFPLPKMSCQGGHADVVPPNPEDPRLNRSDANPDNPRLNCSDESPETLSRIQETPEQIQGSEFPLMGCTGKFVGLESSHGFPLVAMDLDPEGPPVPALLRQGA